MKMLRNSVNTRSIVSICVAGFVACTHHSSQLAPVISAPKPAPASTDVRIGLTRDALLAGALDEISAARLRATDSILAAMGTRHAMSDTLSSTRGIGAARRWIYSTLSGYARDCGGCLRVEYDPAVVIVPRDPQKRSVNVVNVLAWLPGRDPAGLSRGSHPPRRRPHSLRRRRRPRTAVHRAPGELHAPALADG